jgi:hypothetical protein
MSHKKRGYTRDIPEDLVRDYKLFAITCEGGKREPGYFKLFEFLSRKIKVDVIENWMTDNEKQLRLEDKSAPKWVLDRAMKYIEKIGLIEDDDLWFVIDKDNWSDSQIRQLATYCNDYPNWHLAISNPCFEVWLYFHMKADIASSASTCANDFKTEIARFEVGGYNQLKFMLRFQDAIANAKANDSDANHYLPKWKETKVYLLGEAIVDKVGNTDLTEFITVKVPDLVRYETEKLRTAKRK